MNNEDTFQPYGLGRLPAADERDRAFLMSSLLPELPLALPPRRYYNTGAVLNQGATSSCFPPETPVLMADGSEKPISEVRAGDYVITHTGAARMVEATMARRFSGSLVSLKVRGLKEVLRSTPEHPYYASFAERDWSNASKLEGLESYGRLQSYEPGWVEAGTLQPYDRKGKFHYVHISLGKVEPKIYEGDDLYLAQFMPPNASFTVQNGEIRSTNTRLPGIPASVKATRPLMRLLGLYLAEGYTRKGKNSGFQFTFGGHEMALAVEVKDTIKAIFGVDTNIAVRPSNSIWVSAGHVTLARLLEGLCGRLAEGKRVHPALFSADNDLLIALWDGFRAGDGHKRSRRPESSETTLVTVSRQLARDLYRIGLRVNYKPTLNFSDPKVSHGVQTRLRRYDVRAYETAATSTVRRPQTDLHMLAAVESVSGVAYEGLVYNLEVEEDHSYVANFAVVHNCVGHAWRQWISSALMMTKTGPDAFTIYHEAQKVDEWPGEEPDYEGTSVRGGAKYLQAVGHLKEYRWAQTIDDVRVWLLSGKGTVVMGTTWYEGMFSPDPKTGLVKPTGRVAGGHAYLCIGYSEPKGAFRYINSWGRSWGQDGRFWMDGEDAERLLVNEDGEACIGTEKKI